MRVVIAGAGIGGLSAALALARRGIEVQVFEAVTQLRPLGVGINLLPHAMAELSAWGVLEEIAAQGIRTAELCYFNRHGQLIWREPRGLDAGYPVPQVSVHRGLLQQTLLAAVQRRLGADAVRTGHALESFAADGARHVVARFRERADGGLREERADLLVAADGIHSLVRRHFHPDEGPPHWNGQVLWRATSRFAPFLSGRSMFMAGSRRVKFVAYPISAPDGTGLCLVNWIAELDRSGSGAPAREDWNRAGRPEDFAPAFADWRFPWLDVPALIRAASQVFEFPMVDRDPLPGWSHGRVTLLGDAAHPMFPIGSNGASQAILDARALADALVEEPEIEAALARYEAARRPATAAIVLSNRRHGPEVVLDLAEERAPQGFARIEDVFAAGELERIAASYKQIAGFALPGQPAAGTARTTPR
jgi:2-polyprenyl-6-methoxyphenol hydroxylase-like FAD-dependent oxidoreductase